MYIKPILPTDTESGEVGRSFGNLICPVWTGIHLIGDGYWKSAPWGQRKVTTGFCTLRMDLKTPPIKSYISTNPLVI